MDANDADRFLMTRLDSRRRALLESEYDSSIQDDDEEADTSFETDKTTGSNEENRRDLKARIKEWRKASMTVLKLQPKRSSDSVEASTDDATSADQALTKRGSFAELVRKLHISHIHRDRLNEVLFHRSKKAEDFMMDGEMWASTDNPLFETRLPNVDEEHKLEEWLNFEFATRLDIWKYDAFDTTLNIVYTEI